MKTFSSATSLAIANNINQSTESTGSARPGRQC